MVLFFFDGKFTNPNNPFSNGIHQGKYSLWDYFGLPGTSQTSPEIRTSNHVLSFPQRCYNLVWNEFYRDENLCDEVSLTNSTILYRAWKKDYFTSALPWQQRGISPALPISGTLPINLSSISFSDFSFGTTAAGLTDVRLRLEPDSGDVITNSPNLKGFTSNSAKFNSPTFGSAEGVVSSNNGTVNLANATTFDVAVLREAFQIQRWLELNARAGVRYTEFLNAHFGIAPRDEVLQRPEYLGGTKSEIVVSEVLQTSATSDASPQGNLAGHGLGTLR